MNQQCEKVLDIGSHKIISTSISAYIIIVIVADSYFIFIMISISLCCLLIDVN